MLYTSAFFLSPLWSCLFGKKKKKMGWHVHPLLAVFVFLLFMAWVRRLPQVHEIQGSNLSSPGAIPLGRVCFIVVYGVGKASARSARDPGIKSLFPWGNPSWLCLFYCLWMAWMAWVRCLPQDPRIKPLSSHGEVVPVTSPVL